MPLEYDTKYINSMGVQMAGEYILQKNPLETAKRFDESGIRTHAGFPTTT